jgi:hypothetical protein
LEAYLAAHQPGRGSGLKPDPTAVSPPRGTGTPSLIRPESLPVSAERGGDEGGAPAAGPLGNAKIQLPLPATAAGAGADAQEPQRESSGRLDVGRIRRMAATEPRARLPFTDARARGDA